MSKSAAIKHARSKVGKLFKVGSCYKYGHYCKRFDAFIEANSFHWSAAVRARSQSLLDEARMFLGKDLIQLGDGKWTDQI